LKKNASSSDFDYWANVIKRSTKSIVCASSTGANTNPVGPDFATPKIQENQ
jgi:hypothetical protein